MKMLKIIMLYLYIFLLSPVSSSPIEIDVTDGKIEPLPRKQNLEELTENLLICPTNQMIDKLSAYAEAGVDEIIISSGFGQSQSEMIESMHRISEEVIPYFKKFNTQVA